MPTAPVATTTIAIDQIHPNPNQPRQFFDPEAIEDLKRSMTERGLINPISVVKSGEWDYTIIAGERRYRAARELKWDEIDCRIWPKETSPEEVELMAMVENVQRTDLKPLEVAKGYQLLSRPPFNMTQTAIAQQVGKTQQAIQQYLAIANLDPKVQENTNRFVFLGLAHLLQISRLKDPGQQLEMIEQAGKNEWSVKEMTRKVDSILDVKESGKVRLGINVAPKDPLAGVWEAVQGKPDFAPEVLWEVDYKAHPLTPKAKRDGQDALRGWNFFVMVPAAESFQATLATWFAQMAKALQGQKTESLVPEGVKLEQELNSKMRDIMGMAAQHPQGETSSPAGGPRLPRTAQEERELEAIAVRGTPKDVYAWIYGPESFMTKAVPFATWEQSGQSPQEGLKAILDGIKRVRG